MSHQPDLANAPSGFVWAWPSSQRSPVAHLVYRGQRIGEHPGRITVCGKRQRRHPRTMAFQVGGYSAKPCVKCLHAVRA